MCLDLESYGTMNSLVFTSSQNRRLKCNQLDGRVIGVLSDCFNMWITTCTFVLTFNLQTKQKTETEILSALTSEAIFLITTPFVAVDF